MADSSFPEYLIGIGASAGGLSALQAVLAELGQQAQPLSQAAVIVAQHLSPHHPSNLAQLLGESGALPVSEAADGQRLEAGRLYVVPPNYEACVSGGQIKLSHYESAKGPHPSIDTLFDSIAREKREHGVGVLLSGSGHDGAAGLMAIQRNGGLTLVQDPDTAQYDAMPRAAIAAGCVDLVLSPARIGHELQGLLKFAPGEQALDEAGLKAVEAIFQKLTQFTGTDFLNYKPSTMYRRLQKRLALLELESPAAYLAWLEAHPEELGQLFRTVIIGVTCFYRDPEAFARLEAALAALIAHKLPDEALRIWVPGCSSGEEAYSLAFMLMQLLGPRWNSCPLQIFATDLDEQAIAFARQGVYPATALAGLSPELIERCFVPRGNDFEVIKPIRARILFTKHDLTANPPFLKLDLISCRNLLIYFNPMLQKQVLPIFHYALNPKGLLFLGKSEGINEFTDLFETLDADSKLFQRKRGSSLRRIHFSSFRPHRQPHLELPPARRKSEITLGELVKETLFASFEHPYVVINDSLDLQEISGDVRLYLGLGEGALNPNILRLIQPELQLELMSAITRALREQSAIKSPICRFEFFGQTHCVRFVIKPMLYHDKGQDLYLVIFERVEPGDPGAPSGNRSAELEQELEAIRTQLQNYIEELETSNEELQALNEELQSTNEELQSSNEELETSNEELQSTFEEVQAAYAELQASNRSLEESRRQQREAEARMRSLLDNTLQGFILLDEQGRVAEFNQEAERLIRLISGKGVKRGTHFAEAVKPEARQSFRERFEQALAGITIAGETHFIATTGESSWMAFNYSPVQHADTGLHAVSLSLLDISERMRAQERLRAQDLRFRALIERSSEGIAICDLEGMLSYLSPAVEALLGHRPEDLLGRSLRELVHPQEIEACKQAFAQIARLAEEPLRFVWRLRHHDGAWRWIEGVAVNLSTVPEIGGVILNFRDISRRRQQEESLALSEARLRQIIDLIPGYIFARDAEGRYLLANAMTARAFRRPAREIEGHTHIELDPPLHFSPESLAADREVLVSSSIKILPEERLELENGKVQLLRTYKIPYVAPDTGVAVLNVSIDVTELRALEAARGRSEANLRAILENTETGYLLIDTRGRVLACNDQVKAWLRREIGVELSEDHEFVALLPAARQELVQSRLDTAMGGENIAAEVSFGSEDDERAYELRYQGIADRRGAMLGVCLAINDITARKQAERRLRGNEAHLTASQQVAHVGSWELDLTRLDDINVNPLRWSDECFRIFGYAPGSVEVSNELFFSLVHPDDREAIAEAVSQALASNGIYDIEHRILHANGLQRVVHERGEIFLDPQTGVRLKMIGTVQDVTEQRQAESKRVRLLVDLLERNQALEEYSTIVSHQLRAPVANILGCVELLRAGEQDCLEGLADSAAELEQVVHDLNQLLKVRHGNSAQREPVDLPALLEDVRQTLASWLERAQAELVADFEVKTLDCDKAALYSLLMHLISSSLRHRSSDRAPCIEISSRPGSSPGSGDFVQLSVRDNGSGVRMPQAASARPPADGRSLGLYLIKAQVERLKGKLHVHSEPGQPTALIVELPAN